MSPPYPSKVHVAQGYPSVHTDVPPTSVFLFLFITGAVGHMTLLRRNQSRGKKFLFNGFAFGFCMARIVTSCLRISWACYPHDMDLALASTIFTAAGVLLLFLINLIFAQRILRGLHPHLGWHKAASRALLVVYLLIPLLLAATVTASVQSFFASSSNTLRIDLDIQRTAGTYFLFIAFLPIPITLFALLYPKNQEPDHFGLGTWSHKAAVVLIAACLLTTGAGFRVGTAFMPASPSSQYAWYNHKWCWYFFNFGIEITVVYLYLFLRIDKLFHVPDGSKGPGSYSQDRNGSLAKDSHSQSDQGSTRNEKTDV